MFAEIDWALLVFFASLFVVTGAVESLGPSERLFVRLRPLAGGGPAALALASAALLRAGVPILGVAWLMLVR